MDFAAESCLESLWGGFGLTPGALRRVHMLGKGNGLPSSFRVGALGLATIGASALAAGEIMRRRTGHSPRIEVPLDAAMAAFRSERHLRVDGGPAPELWDAIAGNYPCADGWVRLHTNFPHHRDGVLEILGCAAERDAVAEALMNWRGAEFEAEADRRGLCVAFGRSLGDWDDHPQSSALSALPPVRLTRIGDAPSEPLPEGERPLSGIRVLELTRIIAGPVAGRELASHGADVLMITAPHLPSIEVLAIDTGRGKRSAHLDLRSEGETFADLLRDADVYLQGYRPGALATLGFGPEDAARIRPGIVTASLSAYGNVGPWGGKRGFDSLVQMASGINEAEARAAGETKPRALPAQALDHGAGYLLAFGIQTALLRRAEQGGSWHVEVSLARTARLLCDLGQDQEGLRTPDPESIAAHLVTAESGFGTLTAIRPAARIEGAMPFYARPSVPLGTHDPAWD